MEDKFREMYHNDGTIKLIANPDYTEEKLGENYQVGDTWYFVVYISDDGDRVYSEIQRGTKLIPFPVREEISHDVFEYCDENKLR